MSKRTVFTTVSPLPPDMTREAVLAFLHDHEALIDLNPLVIERHPVAGPPPHLLQPRQKQSGGGGGGGGGGASNPVVPEDEREGCAWWSLTDKIAHVPGEVTYAAAFHDLPDGVQTHVYAPLGTDIRERWSLGGTLPGEPPVPVEIGIGAPAQGLYVREVFATLLAFFIVQLNKREREITDVLPPSLRISTYGATSSWPRS